MFTNFNFGQNNFLTIIIKYAKRIFSCIITSQKYVGKIVIIANHDVDKVH